MNPNITDANKIYLLSPTRVFLIISLVVSFLLSFGCQSNISDGSYYTDGFTNDGSYTNSELKVIVRDPNSGKIFVGGRFRSTGPSPAQNIAMYDGGQWISLPDGGLDDSEYSEGASVNALLIKDNKLYIGGTFDKTVGGELSGQRGVAIFDIGTGRWNGTANNGLNGTVNALSIRDNTLFVGGTFNSTATPGITGFNNIAKLALPVQPNAPFQWMTMPGGGVNGTVNTIYAEDGNVIVGGEFTHTSDNPILLNHIAFHTGTVWTGLGIGLNGTVYKIEPGLMNGSYDVFGAFTATAAPGNTPLRGAAGYFAGAWLESFGGLSGPVRSVEKGFVGGEFATDASGMNILHNIGFYNASNGQWLPFPSGGLNGQVNDIECLPPEVSGVYTCLVVGKFTDYFSNAGGNNLQHIASFDLNPDGFTGFGSAITITPGVVGWNDGIALNGPVNGMAKDATGNIYVGGVFTGANNTAAALNKIAKFDPVTRSWTPLANNGLNGQVEALWRVGDDLYVGGAFTATADGAVTNLNRMARYNLTAGTWHAVTHNGLNGNVLSFAQKGNELWVGGSFTRTFDSAVLNLNRLAKYDLMTGTWSSVPNNGMNGDVNALAFKGDDLYLGGAFTRTSDNNYFLFYFTRLDTATGTYYELANSGTNSAVERLRLEGNDLYVSGQFIRTHDNTILLDRLGRYDTTLNGWNAVFGTTDDLTLAREINTTEIINNDRYIGGDFHRVGNTVAHYFTRLYGQVWSLFAMSSDWNDGANWTTGAVPAANTSAAIPTGAGSINISSNDVVLSDLILNGGTLTVGPGRTLTINGILKLGGGVIQGDGTVVVTNCKRDRVMGGSTSSHIRTKLVRCVDNAGTYVFPVGTAQGYAPIFVGEISGTGNVAVTPRQGEYTDPATGLPTNRLLRWWNIDNPGGGVTNSQLIFNYSYPDIISNEPTYKAYRISGGTATVASDVANTYTHRATATNVTAFSDWTIAGDPGGPTPTPTPIPPTPTPTPTPLPSPTPTPTPEPSPTPTPEPTPTPTPEPTPTPPPVPTLGTYSDANLILSGNTVVIPSGAPNGALSISATTDSRFRGTLVADPTTGNVIVANAQPAGLYSIKVTAFGTGGSSTATFSVTVTDGAECTQVSTFTDGDDIFSAFFPTSLAIGDINNDGDQDIAILSMAFETVSIMLGDGTGAFTNAGDVPVTFGPIAIELADINNDGKLDLVVLASGRLSNRLGNGDGTFTNLPIINVSDSPDAIAVGDMNNDGKRDIVLTFSSSAKVRVLTGDGAGAFSLGPEVPVDSGQHNIVLADVNGDGNTDVLAANGGSNSVSVRLGDGLGGLSGTTEIAVGMTPVSMTTGQFDADGNLDLATANSGDGTVSIRSGDGLGGFTGTASLTSAATPTVVTSGDPDNDGVHDIVVGDSTTPADIVHFGDGSGGFVETLPVPAGGWPYAIKIGDLNGDGRQDLVTGNWSSFQTTIRLGSCYTPTPTPTPTPEETPTPTPTPTPQTNNITVSDNNLTVGSYNTLKEAFDAINAGAHIGAITMTVNSDTTETAMSNLTYSGDGMANYTSITISPLPGGPRVISGLMADGDALIDLNGADNVVFDGINSGGTTLTLANTTTVLSGTPSTIRFENGATSNVIRNTNILGSSGSVVLFYNDAVTPNGNDNNTIENCNIGPFGNNPPNRGVYGVGQSFDGNIGNSGNIINNNNIYDFFNPVGESNGVYLLGGSKFWQVTNNRFYQTAPRVGGVQNVIRMDNPNAPNGVEGMTVTGNVIGYANSNGTDTYTLTGTTAFSAIRARIFIGGAPTTISNNTISGISLSHGSAGLTFYGIHLEQGPFITNSNLIGSMTSNNAITVDFNTTVDVNNAGIINFATSSDWTANNNQVGGIRVANANTGGPQVYGIWGFRSSPNLAGLSGNTVGGTVADSMNVVGFGTNQQVIGIATNFSSTVSGNTVQNLTTNAGSGTGAGSSAIGILTNNAAVNQTISNNVIRNIRNSRTFGTNVVTGIQFTGSTANTVERNQIINLFNDSPGTSAEVNGIRVSGGTTAYRNNMIGVGDNILNAIGTGSTTGGVNGISETAGTNTFYHNSVSITGLPTAGAGPSYALNSSVTANARGYRNNIFANTRSNNGSTGKNYLARVGGTGVNPAGLTINNNLYYSSGSGAVFGFYALADRSDLTAWQTATGQDAASIGGDPLFLNALVAGTPDLHIMPASPARNAGANLGVANDLDGQLRPIGTGVDIGADEVLDPSAATVSVSGRLTTAAGNGIRNATVTLTDSNGVVMTVSTGSFGYYRFDEVIVGQAYVLTVTSKRYQFVDPSRLIILGEDAVDIDFIALP